MVGGGGGGEYRLECVWQSSWTIHIVVNILPSWGLKGEACFARERECKIPKIKVSNSHGSR